MKNPFEGPPEFNEEPNEQGESNNDENKPDKSESGTGWRKVEEGEVFEPGREFRLDIDTGENYVWEGGAKSSEDNNEQLENPLEDIDPKAEAEFSQEYIDSEVNDVTSNFAEGWNEFSNKEKQADDFDVSEEGTSFYKDHFKSFFDTAKSVSDAFENNNKEEAKDMAWEFINSLKNKASDYFADKIEDWFKEYDQTTTAAEQETNVSKKDKLKKLAIDGVDFIPVVGSTKMIAESAAGETLGGEKLSSFRRLMHGTEGSVFLAMDLTGLAPAADGLKAAKLMSRSSALMRKIGLSEKIYKPAYKFGEFIGKHPTVAKVADRAVQYTAKRRKSRKVDWAKKIPEVVLED